jgi:hypothetical protein
MNESNRIPPGISPIDLNDLLFMISVPVALLALGWLLGWLFRRFVDRSINPPVKLPRPAMPSSPKQTPPPLVPLRLRRLETCEVDPVSGQAAMALSEARVAARSGHAAYTAAGLLYVAITTLVMTLGMSALVYNWPAYAKFFLVYLRQGPALVLLVWFARFSLPTQCAILGGYLLVGLLALPTGLALLALPISPNLLLRNATSVGLVSWYTLVLPMAALLVLLSKPLRPWLIGVFAIALYLLTGVGALFLIDKVFKLDWRLFWIRPWETAGSVICLIVATTFVGSALRHRSWHSPLAWLGLAVLTGLLVNWLLPESKVGLWLLGFSIDVLQVLFVWSLFKGFMLLQEWQSLPAQVLHSHLCWGFLAFHAAIMLSYLQRWWTSWMVAMAYGLYVIVLHSILHKFRAARIDRPSKRLLLLRVFGRADRRETLPDLLDDTWRHLGRIDLIAGTDLAMRTLGSRMLEAFLLRRADQQFLKTAEEVDRRLEHLHSRLEGDARYPINNVYCYATAWQRAVERLALKSDVVLMDLRGFTNRNQGCMTELTLVVQRIPLSRIVLLTDSSSDYQALERVAQAAWAKLPPKSPNADLCQPVLRILNAPRWTKEDRSALFNLLLSASYSSKEVFVEADLGDVKGCG